MHIILDERDKAELEKEIGKKAGLLDLEVLTRKLERVESYNVLDESKCTLGYMTTAGDIGASSTLSYSAKIQVNPGDVVRYYITDSGNLVDRHARFFTAFDANDSVLPDRGAENLFMYTVPAGVAYVVVTVDSSKGPMLTINREATEYKPYGEPYYRATMAFLEGVGYDSVQQKVEQAESDIEKLISDTQEMAADVEDLKKTGQTTIDLSEVTRKMEKIEASSNIYRDEDYTLGYIANTGGTVVSSTNLKYSAKIPVQNGDVIRCYRFVSNVFEATIMRFVTAFDGNDNILPYHGGENTEEYAVPSDLIKYIIITLPVGVGMAYHITVNEEATEYEPYAEGGYYKATPEFVGIASETSFGLVKAWVTVVNGETVLNLSTEE